MFEGMSREEIFAARDEAIDMMRWAETRIDDFFDENDHTVDVGKMNSIMKEEEVKVKEIEDYIERMGWDEDDDD